MLSPCLDTFFLLILVGGSKSSHSRHSSSNGNISNIGNRSNQLFIRWTPHLVIVTIGDNRDYTRVLLYSYYTTITGWVSS